MRLVNETELSKIFDSFPHIPRVVVSGNEATPFSTLRILDGVIENYRLFAINAQRGFPDREGVELETTFVGPGMRNSSRLRYIPARLSMTPLLFRTTLAPDIVLLNTSVPEGDTVSLGIEVNILPSAIEEVRRRGGLVIAQINKHMPYTFGDGQLLLDHIDIGIEIDEPLPTLVSTGELDDESLSIGERVASMVADGSTLQMGIGAVPNATLSCLFGHRDLKIWSEMFSDGVLALERRGVLRQKDVIHASFCFGSPEFYAWLNHNDRVRIMRTEKINDPSMIEKNPLMVSVNTAMQIDLFAQANATRIGNHIYSGIGGQTDFIVGALHSHGGQALIALRSWHRKANQSTIIPVLDSPVTSFQQSAIVTEQGVAQLWGLDQREQARELIEQTAHPDAREELRFAALRMGLAE
ncbi:MAG TPA: acetyl-CoA hydrolase/transferase C-terminal domain-containing protein [Candidatus Nanopelagicaceae bacterium]|nr:acetyl-CoA hydrolase/transferase C-terminal domain-containing protein [Candidatus Nanopelagicaceae bacterium]